MESSALTLAATLFSRTMVNKYLLGTNDSLLLNLGEKLPSIYADARGELAMDWIKEQTAEATFCRRSDQVKEVKGGKMWFIVLTFFIYF